MGFFKSAIPKGVEVLTFPSLSDGLLYGVVNIETARIKISKDIPEGNPNMGKEFSIQTGEGDGDYPVFLFDEKEWFDDESPSRPGWGAFVPFHRNALESTLRDLVGEDERGEFLQSYSPVGYFPDKEFQFVAGRTITYVADIEVDGKLYLSEESAVKGSGHAFVDILLHNGRYLVFVIEDSMRDKEMDDYLKEAFPEEKSLDEFDVISSLVIVHEDKLGKLNKTIYKKNPDRLAEIEERLAGKDVVGKVMTGPNSYNAVYRSFWIAVWSLRYKAAFSWNLQGLTFEKKYRHTFTQAFIDANGQSATQDQLEEAAKSRGINLSDANLPK